MKRWQVIGCAVLICTTVWLQVRLWGGEGSLAHVDSLSQRVALKNETNESRRQRNRVLVAEIKDLKNGLDAVEELARSEFGLIRDGETFFLIVDE